MRWYAPLFLLHFFVEIYGKTWWKTIVDKCENCNFILVFLFKDRSSFQVFLIIFTVRQSWTEWNQGSSYMYVTTMKISTWILWKASNKAKITEPWSGFRWNLQGRSSAEGNNHDLWKVLQKFVSLSWTFFHRN